MRYKPGDRVVVRHDLEEGKRYYMDDGGLCDIATSEMVELAGQTVTIRERPSPTDGKYYIKEGRWYWTDDMFEGLESEQTPLEMDGEAWSSFFSSYQTGV